MCESPMSCRGCVTRPLKIVRAEVYPVPNLDRLNLLQLWARQGALEGDLLPVFPPGISSMIFLQNLRGDRDAGPEASWIR